MQVYTANYKNKLVAVKKLHSSIPTPEFVEEINIMRSVKSRYLLLSLFFLYSKYFSAYLNYRYVVELIAVCIQKPPLALVMEFVNGGTLSQLLYSDLELPWQIRLALAEEIALGIADLHSHTPQVWQSPHIYIPTWVGKRAFLGMLCKFWEGEGQSIYIHLTVALT